MKQEQTNDSGSVFLRVIWELEIIGIFSFGNMLAEKSTIAMFVQLDLAET